MQAFSIVIDLLIYLFIYLFCCKTILEEGEDHYIQQDSLTVTLHLYDFLDHYQYHQDAYFNCQC